MRQLASLCLAVLIALAIPASGEAHYFGGRGEPVGGGGWGPFRGGGWGPPHGDGGFHPGGVGGFHAPSWAPGRRPPFPMPPTPPFRGPIEPLRDGAPPPPEPVMAPSHGPFVPLDRVLGNIKAYIPGRQLDTFPELEDGRPVYRIRWLTKNGRVLDIVADQSTGRILGER